MKKKYINIFFQKGKNRKALFYFLFCCFILVLFNFSVWFYNIKKIESKVRDLQDYFSVEFNLYSSYDEIQSHSFSFWKLSYTLKNFKINHSNSFYSLISDMGDLKLEGDLFDKDINIIFQNQILTKLKSFSKNSNNNIETKTTEFTVKTKGKTLEEVLNNNKINDQLDNLDDPRFEFIKLSLDKVANEYTVNDFHINLQDFTLYYNKEEFIKFDLFEISDSSYGQEIKIKDKIYQENHFVFKLQNFKVNKDISFIKNEMKRILDNYKEILEKSSEYNVFFQDLMQKENFIKELESVFYSDNNEKVDNLFYINYTKEYKDLKKTDKDSEQSTQGIIDYKIHDLQLKSKMISIGTKGEYVYKFDNGNAENAILEIVNSEIDIDNPNFILNYIIDIINYVSIYNRNNSNNNNIGSFYIDENKSKNLKKYIHDNFSPDPSSESIKIKLEKKGLNDDFYISGKSIEQLNQEITKQVQGL